MTKYLLKSMAVLALCLSSCLLITGCEAEDSEDDITANSFNLERDLTSYDGTDTYTWDTTLSQATAEIRIKDFRAGDAVVQVFDSRGKQILKSVLVTPNYTLYVGDNEFVKTDQTDMGTSGVWKIQLSYDQFTGEQTIKMY